MNKKTKIILTSLLTAVVVGGTSVYVINILNNTENSESSNQLLNGGIVENGVQVKLATIVESEAKYGAQKFTYSVYPELYTGTIEFDTCYEDGSEVEEGILTITHDKDNYEIIVECNEVFTKKIKLKLYSSVNEEVNATITLDFLEKLSVDSTLSLTEGSNMKFNSVVNTTGGTIEVDKTISNETAQWNSDFVIELKDYIRENVARFSTDEEMLNYYSEIYTSRGTSWKFNNVFEFYVEGYLLGSYSDGNFSINSSNLENCIIALKSNTYKFNLATFLDSCRIQMSATYSGSTGLRNEFIRFDLIESDTLENDMDELFTNCIDYSCVVNETTYSKQFSLEFDTSVLVPTRIEISDTNIIF